MRVLQRVVAPLLLASATAVAAPAVSAQAAPTPSPTPRPVACEVQPATGVQTGGQRLGAAGRQLDLPAGVPAPPGMAATSWLVADLNTGDVLAACNAHVRLLPASTLKTLAAVTLIPSLDPRAEYTATPADANIDGTKVGLVPGSLYTVDQLAHAMLMSSANDASQAIGMMSGGIKASAAKMNEEARRLGALDTHAANTCGLDAAGQLTSAYDLALFGRAALAQPYISKILVTRTFSFPAGKPVRGPRPHYEIQTHNKLLASFPGTVGVKNGFTVHAKGTYIAAARRGGRAYVVTVMHASQPAGVLSQQLLTWAFADGAKAAPVGRLADTQAGSQNQTQPATTADPSPAATTAGAAQPPTQHATTSSTAQAISAQAAAATSSTGSPRLAALGYIGAAVLAGLGLSVYRTRRQRVLRAGEGVSGSRHGRRARP